MAKHYTAKCWLGYEYEEVWKDSTGVLLEVIKNPTGLSNPRERIWVSNYIFKSNYVELIPEKWIVLKEWSDGHFTCDCEAFNSKMEAELWMASQQNYLGRVSTSDYGKGKYVFKVVKV